MSDYLDESTRLIVDGYIRQSEQLLSPLSLINHIPSEISTITLLYIDDYFMMYRGSYEWKITNQKVIRSILSAQNDQKWSSNVFEIGKLPWVLNLFPNGHTATNTPQGQVAIYIEILSFPSSWKYLLMGTTIYCSEMGNKVTFTAQYEQKNEYWGINDIFLLNDIITQNPNQLTFTVSMKILRIMQEYNSIPYIKYQSTVNDYKKYYKLYWKHNVISTLKSYSDVTGEMFCASYTPSTATVRLILCGLPNKKQTDYVLSYINSFQVQWKVNVINMDIQCNTVATIGFGEDDNDYSVVMVPLLNNNNNENENEIEQKIDQYIFEVSVEILTEYDLNGKAIGIDIAAEWDKYLMDNNELKNNNSKNNKENIGFSGFKFDLNNNENNINQNQNQNYGSNTHLTGASYEMNGNGGSVPNNAMKMLTEISKQQKFILEQLDDIKKEITLIKSGNNNNLNVDKNELEIFKDWLKNEVKLEQYFSILVENGFDSLDIIKTTDMEQLKKIGIVKIGHRQKLMQHILWLQI
eukprot:355091_1